MNEFKDNVGNVLEKNTLYDLVVFQKKFPQPLLYKNIENKTAFFEDFLGKKHSFQCTEINFIYKYTSNEFNELKNLFSWIKHYTKFT